MNEEFSTTTCSNISPITVRQLETLWHTTVPKVCDIDFTRPMTMKDRGMLKNFIRFVSPHDARTILDFVLNDWAGFRSYTEESAGVKVSPIYPSIPFLAKYCEQAVNFKLKSCRPIKLIVPTSVVPPSEFSTTSIVACESNSGERMTLEEIEKIEKEFGL